MNCHDQFNNANNVNELANGIASNSNGILKNLFTPECVSAEYLPVLIFIVIALGLSIVIILIPFIINKLRPDQEKNSPYECGFEGQGIVRNKFSVQFYLVAILFIIFDLEIAFLFPWAVVLKQIGVFGYVSMMIFLGLLTIGFVYEWKRGALEWK
jgi:NADH-quinone oxidoreductase subunit A